MEVVTLTLMFIGSMAGLAMLAVHMAKAIREEVRKNKELKEIENGLYLHDDTIYVYVIHDVFTDDFSLAKGKGKPKKKKKGKARKCGQ